MDTGKKKRERKKKEKLNEVTENANTSISRCFFSLTCTYKVNTLTSYYHDGSKELHFFTPNSFSVILVDTSTCL